MRVSARIEGGIEWVVDAEWLIWDVKLKSLRYREPGKELVRALEEVIEIEVTDEPRSRTVSKD